VWYVVLAPSTETIVALGALACGRAARSAQPSDVTAQKQATVAYHLKNSGLKAPALTDCHDKGKLA